MFKFLCASQLQGLERTKEYTYRHNYVSVGSVESQNGHLLYLGLQMVKLAVNYFIKFKEFKI